MILDLLKKHFPTNYNYLITLKNCDKIDVFLRQKLYDRTLSAHKKDIWGKHASVIPFLGRNIGWVPDNLDTIFFADTVLLEIAESLAAVKNRIIPDNNMIDFANRLLLQLDLNAITYQKPYMLSEGESKLIWFLCQYVKFPQFFIIANLTSNLSKKRVEKVLDFINESDKIAEIAGCRNPCFIIGYPANNETLFTKLTDVTKWKSLDQWQLNVD